MARLSPSTAHDVEEIKIMRVKGQTTDWYTIYLDDLMLCCVFGMDKKLPNIVTFLDDDCLKPRANSALRKD